MVTIYFYIFQEYDKAIEDLTIYLDALESFGKKDDEIFLERAMGYYYSGENEKAYYDFQQLIASESEAVSINDYLPISDCYVVVEDYENSIALLDTYILKKTHKIITGLYSKRVFKSKYWGLSILD